MDGRVNTDRIRKAWTSRGFGCDLWTDPPGQLWADFVHSTDELVMLLEGEIEISLQGKTFRPKIGDEVLIPAGTPHTVRNTGRTPNRWLYGYRLG